MKNQVASFLFLLFFCLVFFCVEMNAQNSQLTVNQDPRIPQLLKTKKELEKNNKLTDNFTIQLYYGNLSSANSVLSNYRSKYAKWPASIEYETPNYKVWVGNYSSRLEADRALMDIHRNFPSAFVLKPGKNKKDD